MKGIVYKIFEVLIFIALMFLIMQNFFMQVEIQKGQELRQEILNEIQQGAKIRQEILKTQKTLKELLDERE